MTEQKKFQTIIESVKNGTLAVTDAVEISSVKAAKATKNGIVTAARFAKALGSEIKESHKANQGQREVERAAKKAAKAEKKAAEAAAKALAEENEDNQS